MRDDKLPAAAVSQPPCEDTRIQGYERLKKYLLKEEWHKKIEIVHGYMPNFPDKDTQPTNQIRYNDGTEWPPYLRYSRGPRQGFFWDIYGDHFHDDELAIIAISEAPAPYYVGPIVFRIPIPQGSPDGETPQAKA